MKTIVSIIGMIVCIHVNCCAYDNLELLIHPQEISERILQVAAQINKEYDGEELTLIMIMKGSLCVTADLIRELDVPCKLQAITASSYGQNGTRSGALTITGLDRLTLENQHVIVIDDMFDSGKTMTSVMAQIQLKNPKSLKSLVLLLKNVPHVTSYVPEYVLFQVENRFVVGYGLDYKEFYRGLPGIYAFINDEPSF